jgi:hypothetical protein
VTGPGEPEFRPTLLIDGTRFHDFDGFCQEVSAVLTPGTYQWHGNLDVFVVIIRGDFGTPEEGFVLVWRNSEISRSALGWDATIARYEQVLRTCHPSNRSRIRDRIDEARHQSGQTLFELLVAIIRDRGPDGKEPEYGVELVLA